MNAADTHPEQFAQRPTIYGVDLPVAPAARMTRGATKRRLVETLIVFILICMVGVSWLANRTAHVAVASARWETHTHEVIAALDNLLSSLKDAETGQRGFLITGKREFLMPYQASLAVTPTELAKLRRLTVDNPQQQQRLAALEPLIAAKLTELQRVIALRQTEGFPAVQEAVMTHVDKNLMDQIRTLVNEAQVQEAQLLKYRVTTSEADVHKTSQLALLGGTLGVVALLMLFISLRWELIIRRRTETALQAGEERYWSLFNSINEGFCIIEMIFDADQKPIDYRFLEVNPAFERQSGMHDVVGKRIREIAPDLEAYWFEIYANVALTGKSQRFSNKSKAWHNRWFDVYALRFGGTHSVKVAVLFIDITEHKNARDEILSLNAELEERVHQRTAQLEAANQELESFSYSVSHDLRSPLSTIDGFSQLLERTVGDKAGEKAKHYLKRIRTSTRQMSELIEGLLSLAQLSRATLLVEAVDLSAIARRVEQDCRERDPHRQVQVCIEENMRAHGDPRQLSIVIQNLLSNAWKFTAKRATAQIDIGSEAGENGETIYFVKDNGAGFDMAHAKKLFGTFERLHSVPEFSGTGIGLATVKRVIDRHAGRVWAEGKENEGASFYFALRRVAKPETPALS